MENSPFNRSSRTLRSPPPGPVPTPPAQPTREEAPETIPTSEISSWMTNIEQYLNEVCCITAEGKLNSEQKLRINNLCRKVAHGTSQMAVQYQALKMKALRCHSQIQTLEEQCHLSERLHDLKLTIRDTKKPAPGPSFADMVKKGNNNYVTPLNISSVAIYPSSKTKSSEETKSLVQKIICPEELKLQVRGLRKTKNGGVIISTETKEDIEKLKNSVQLTNSGLTIDEPFKRNPRVVVIGVPTTLQDKEVFTCLYHQNLSDKLQNYNLESFLGSIKLSHKSGKKEAETCNFIIEVPAAIRKVLIANERVFVNWSSCPVRDFTLVTRCFKCQQYGHAAKTCREPVCTCSHCGEGGHSIKECPKATEAPKCASCLRFKKPSSHKTGATDCPAKIMAEKRYINSINYEGA